MFAAEPDTRNTQVEVWDFKNQKFVPHIPCKGEKRVRVDYHGDLSDLAVYEVWRSGDEFFVLQPARPLRDWRIDLS